MTLSRPWLLPFAPVVAVLLVALALVPLTPGSGRAEPVWLLGFLALSVALAAGVAFAARHLVPAPVVHRIAIAVTTGVVTALVPFAVGLLLGGPTRVFPWLFFGLVAACWQLFLCEGPRSLALHAVIGFGYTFCFAGLTLFLTLAASGLVH